MNQVIVLCSRFETHDDDRAVAARAFVAAYALCGVRTHVIVPNDGSSRPAFECDGLIDVHRLDAPAGRNDAPFAARAVARAAEIAARHSVRAIECFDAPWCAVFASAARVTGAHTCPVFAVNSSRGTDPSHTLAAHFADQSQSLFRFDSEDQGGTVHTPIPCVPDVISMPRASGPAFVLPTPQPHQTQTMIIDAFKCVQAKHPAWSLACATGGGRWMIADAGESSSIHPDDRASGSMNHGVRVMIAPDADGRGPATCMMLMCAGTLCLMRDTSPLIAYLPKGLLDALTYPAGDARTLSERMLVLAGLSDQERRSWSAVVSGPIAERSKASNVVVDRIASWRAMGRKHHRQCGVEAWKFAEATLASCGRSRAERAV